MMSKPRAAIRIVTLAHRNARHRSVPPKPESMKTIVTAKRPRRGHYGEIVDDPPDPPDYEATTERARQIIQRRLRSPD